MEDPNPRFPRNIYIKKIFDVIFAAIEANKNAEDQLELETVLNIDRMMHDFKYKSAGYDKWQKRWNEYVLDNEKAVAESAAKTAEKAAAEEAGKTGAKAETKGAPKTTTKTAKASKK